MEFQEKLNKIEVISKTILELKSSIKTPLTKLRIQKLQQELDKITMS